MKTILCMFVLIVICLDAYSEEIVATIEITGIRGSLSDPKFADSVIVLRNTGQKEWLAIWTESFRTGDIGTKEIGYGRRVSDNGAQASAKKLQKSSAIFDAEYDPDHGIYMLLVDRFDSINAQAYKTSLAKKGSAQDLSKLFNANTQLRRPQVVYAPDTKTFSVFGVTQKGACTPSGCFQDVQMFQLDESGKPISTPTVLVTGKNGRQITQLEALRNSASNNTLLLVNDSEVFGPTNTPRNLLAYFAKPDGKLLKQKAMKVASSPPCSGIGLTGSAAFDLKKGGIVGWSVLACDGSSQQTNFKRIKTTEKGLTATKKLADGTFPPGMSNSIATFFDELNEEYVFLWHDLGTLKGARVDASTGNPVGTEFTLATANVSSIAEIREIAVSYDAVSGRALAVWIETVGFHTFQVRGVVFQK